MREAIVSNNMTKIQEAQSRIEMALEAKKRSNNQLEELKAKKQKLDRFLPVPITVHILTACADICFHNFN